MNKLNSNKKAQVTVFIIIGILLLVGAATFFYIAKTTSQESKLEAEIKIAEEQVPTQFNSIKKYANDCAYSVAVDGLKLIGKQGGYVSFDGNRLNKEVFATRLNPTESDAVSFTSNSDLKTAYWYYLKSASNCNDDCDFASRRPALRETDNSIEIQLERYVDAKYKDCINNFEPFVEQGFIITEESSPETNVVIAADDVKVLVDYKITAKIQDAESEISKFLVTIPIDLENIYEFATKITNMQIETSFIEDFAVELISAFSGVEENNLPPTSEFRFDLGGSTVWTRSEVKARITEMLAAHIQLFQVDGSYNYERNIFDTSLRQSIYDSTIIPIANESFSNLAASFSYLNFWPIYLDMNCDGELCRFQSIRIG